MAAYLTLCASAFRVTPATTPSSLASVFLWTARAFFVALAGLYTQAPLNGSVLTRVRKVQSHLNRLGGMEAMRDE